MFYLRPRGLPSLQVTYKYPQKNRTNIASKLTRNPILRSTWAPRMVARLIMGRLTPDGLHHIYKPLGRGPTLPDP